MSEQTYYEGSDYGDYGYVTLEQIVDDYMAGREPGDVDALTPRHIILGHAKRGLRNLHYDALREVRAIEMDVSANLSIPLPPDYVNYVRISWVDVYGNLYPMAENKSLSISRQYLQDSDYNLLFDVSGNILLGTPTTQAYQETEGNGIKEYSIVGTAFAPNLDKSERFNNGSYRIHKEEGLIRFDSNVYTKSVVLEYISDGLYFDTTKGESEADARVHKFAEEALHAYIYYQVVRKKRGGNINQYTKRDAKKDFYNQKRLVKRRLQQFTIDELLQAAKAANVWIKGSR